MNKVHQANIWIFNQSVKCAAKDDVPFELTKEELMKITDLDCVYCGEQPKNFKRSLVDRRNPSDGYTKDNTVPACADCARSKGSCDASTFVARCRHVSFVNGGPGGQTTKWNNVKHKTYEQYKKENIHKNFQLSSEQYYDLRRDECVYCKRETTPDHMNGIDRLDCDMGYVPDNCVSCCHDCNILKLVSTREAFVAHMVKIAVHTSA
jgi:hypothetical protein